MPCSPIAIRQFDGNIWSLFSRDMHRLAFDSLLSRGFVYF